MGLIANNLPESFFIIGLVLLVVEVAVLGFTTFVLFFVGIAAMITGVLLFVGVLPNNELSALLSTAAITAVSALVLWKPLKSMQSNVSPKKAQGDLIGHRFILQQAVSPTKVITYHYSGVSWKLLTTEPIEAGTQVEVVEAEVGAFHIRPIEP